MSRASRPRPDTIDALREEARAVSGNPDPEDAREAAVRFVEGLAHLAPAEIADGQVERELRELAERVADHLADATEIPVERLWHAIRADRLALTDPVAARWGELLPDPGHASTWADAHVEEVREGWSASRKVGGHTATAVPVLSALLAANRPVDVIELLKRAPEPYWPERRFGVEAYLHMDARSDARRFAEPSLSDPVFAAEAARVCEDILLDAGLTEEAYRRYALVPDPAQRPLDQVHAIARRHPSHPPDEVLRELVAATGVDGDGWFDAALALGAEDVARELATSPGRDPERVMSAARAALVDAPELGLDLALAALRRLAAADTSGATARSIVEAHELALSAGSVTMRELETRARIRAIVETDASPDRRVRRVVGRHLT